MGLSVVGEVTQATVSHGAWELSLTPPIEGNAPLRVVVPGLLNSSLEAGQRLWVLGLLTRETIEASTDSSDIAPTGVTLEASFVYVL